MLPLPLAPRRAADSAGAAREPFLLLLPLAGPALAACIGVLGLRCAWEGDSERPAAAAAAAAFTAALALARPPLNLTSSVLRAAISRRMSAASNTVASATCQGVKEGVSMGLSVSVQASAS